MHMPRLVSTYTLLAVVLAACAALPVQLIGQTSAASGIAWQSRLNADNPLVGTIYSAHDKAVLSPEELIDRIGGERFLLIGEIHDNPDHHVLQAVIIKQLAKRGRRPAIVMEQINADQEGLLKLFLSGRNKSAARLGPSVEWEKQGWPEWKYYQPIAEAAFDAGLVIHAGDSSKATNRKIGANGLEVLPSTELTALGLQHPLAAKLETALISDLVLSHCSMMPAERMRPMYNVQRYRDAYLAQSMRQADSTDGAVLIAGNGHVRTDRAVPWYLRGDRLPSLSVMLVEAQKDATSALDLIPLDPDGKPTADFIWVTPGAEREDPCAGLSKHLMEKKSPKSGG